MVQEVCLIEKNFEAIQRYAKDRGIILSECNLVQDGYGGTSLSINHNANMWYMCTVEWNKKFILYHVNKISNRKGKSASMHEHKRSKQFCLIIEHIVTHHSHEYRKRTRKNRRSLSLEKAFEQIKKEKK